MNNLKFTSTVAPYVILLLSVLSGVTLAGGRMPAAKPDVSGRPAQRSLVTTPQNIAAYAGETVILECRVAEPPPNSRIMWGEFITNSGGNIISDNELILDHPNKDRYRIINVSPIQYDLEIRDVTLADGGKYVCQNTLSGPPNTFRGEAELIVLDAAPNCTTTAPLDGQVIEGHEFTIECFIHYQGQYPPTMTWSGPEPFNVANSPPNPTTVWSGISYQVDRSFDTRAFECLTNFTDIGNVPADVANNTPTWQHLFRGNQIFVSWGPKNLYALPIKPEYQVGDQITCFADAWPEPAYQWQNMISLDFVRSNTFTVTADMVGQNTTLRCQAQNEIQGLVYSANLFIYAYVPSPTTVTTPPSTPPTTTLPAFDQCGDLSGWWISHNPYAEIILSVVHESEIGEIIGLLKNQSDTVWVEVVGTVRRGDYVYIGVTAVWPFDTGITGMAGECHNCRGVEVILAETMWRAKANSIGCGLGSIAEPDVAYSFNRVGSSSILKEQEFDVLNPTKDVSGKLGIRLKKRK